MPTVLFGVGLLRWTDFNNSAAFICIVSSGRMVPATWLSCSADSRPTNVLISLECCSSPQPHDPRFAEWSILLETDHCRSTFSWYKSIWVRLEYAVVVSVADLLYIRSVNSNVFLKKSPGSPRLFWCDQLISFRDGVFFSQIVDTQFIAIQVQLNIFKVLLIDWQIIGEVCNSWRWQVDLQIHSI